jgi:hypothetical protein
MDSHSPSAAPYPLENRSARSVVDLACSYVIVLMQGRRLLFKYLYVYLARSAVCNALLKCARTR